MKQIIKILPSDGRQTMLFSATQTTKVEDLARISLRPGPLFINVEEEKQYATAEGIEQGYVVCDADKRFLLVSTCAWPPFRRALGLWPWKNKRIS